MREAESGWWWLKVEGGGDRMVAVVTKHNDVNTDLERCRDRQSIQ